MGCVGNMVRGCASQKWALVKSKFWNFPQRKMILERKKKFLIHKLISLWIAKRSLDYSKACNDLRTSFCGLFGRHLLLLRSVYTGAIYRVGHRNANSEFRCWQLINFNKKKLIFTPVDRKFHKLSMNLEIAWRK